MALRQVILIIATILGGAHGVHSQPLTYAAMGASDAAGIGAEPLTNGYVFRIRGLLRSRDREVTLVNLGIPGGQSRHMRRIELPLAILSSPDLVTIWAGPNDLVSGKSAASFRSNVSAILKSLRHSSNAAVFIATVPDLTLLPRFLRKPDRDVTRQRVISYNQVIYREARRYGVKVVDLYSQRVSGGDVSQDGFHPSNEGHARIAALFWRAIQPVL